MYILEVSYGCPSDKYPLNGIFQMDQAKALAEIGNKVIFAAIDVRSIRKWRRWGISEHTESGIPVIEFNVPIGPIFQTIREKICRIGFSLLLRKVIDKYGKPDIVHVHFGGTALCVVEACQREGIPFVVTEHSSGINRDDMSEAEIAPMRYVYQNASAVIAVSGALANRIKQYTGIPTRVIPNIVDFSSFSLERKAHEGFHFVSAANLNYGKGFDVLLNAFKRCLDDGMQATLTIMGDGPVRQELLSQIKNVGIADSVTFFGKYSRAQFAEELSRSDCFALASRGETFGVVYAEALACGVPVIATRCGGPEDFVDTMNGLLVNIDDEEGLMKAMIDIYNNAEKYCRNRISENAKERFLSRRVAFKISKIFEECLNEGAREKEY